MLPLLVLASFGSLPSWEVRLYCRTLHSVMFAFGVSLLAMLVTYLVVDGTAVFVAIGVGLVAWFVLFSRTELVLTSGFGNARDAHSAALFRRHIAFGLLAPCSPILALA